GRSKTRRIALRRAGVRPAPQGADFRGGQDPFAFEIPISPLRFPWGHVTARGDLRDEFGALCRVPIGHERNRAHFTRRMEGDAMVIKDRSDIARERDGLRCAACLGQQNYGLGQLSKLRADIQSALLGWPCAPEEGGYKPACRMQSRPTSLANHL